jgi:hypothetical protein
LQLLLTRGLRATAALWPDIRLTYGWVHRAAHLLANGAGRPGAQVRCAYAALLAEMAEGQAAAGTLSPAVSHFLKVTRSYGPGLFHCYDVPDLPRTNNDLEHYFGSARYHQRRATGCKHSAPGTVIRGAVRLVTAVTTRSRRFQPLDLRPRDVAHWRQLRRELAQREQARRTMGRFRRDPTAYLQALEDQLLKLSLPP